MYQSKTPVDGSFDPRRIGTVVASGEFSRDEHDAGPKAMMIYAYPYVTPDGAKYLIETGNTYTRTHETLRRLAWMFGWIGPIATLLALAGGWFAIGRALATKPTG